MPAAHILGYPRIGPRRELKFALESFWRSEIGEQELLDAGNAIRSRNITQQIASGLALVSAGDFSLYDHVLDHAALLGGLPARFEIDPRHMTLQQYFALARGNAHHRAMEMTKWFDTNYHYLVPELARTTQFGGGSEWYFESIAEAQKRGVEVKAILQGPLTFLKLSRMADDGDDALALMPALAHAYAAVMRRLHAMGIGWVQIDEPALCLDLDPASFDAMASAYAVLALQAPKLLLATYFGDPSDHIDRIVRLAVNGIHLDLVRAPGQLERWHTKLPSHWTLSAGVVDGRNVWRTDLLKTLRLLQPLHDRLGARLWIAPSCSLMHVPVTVTPENNIDPKLRTWLAFADEKLDELATLARALQHGEQSVRTEIERSERIQAERKSSQAVSDSVRARVAALTSSMHERASPYPVRARKQRSRLNLAPLPTTTIGSFPQTAAVRRTRAAYRRGDMGCLDYLEAMRAEIRHVIERQDALGLDVLVHGEAERNDMVEFFAEHLWGFALTQNGWVQSYGSRCVKPPIVYGDVSRPEPITVDTTRYAQSLTSKPVKGMLTGPVTMLRWSYVRDDVPSEHALLQIALAIRDEVADLQSAGISIIQIDEPALREGLPLRRKDWGASLDSAVHAFRLAASVAADETQVHTHMCYSEFDDILPAIAKMDADVVTIEASRSHMSLLDAFRDFCYPNDIGPGVYDIHSPRIPDADELVQLIERAAKVVPAERLWVNPDCGLKTRDWPEVETALRNMVNAAARVRQRMAG
jgi:5-methyltetrahydropteroyltriglutamate--homocysteine methyltransferase